MPQGSVLGPLLFLIYINDHTKINLSDRAKLTLYADDILLFRTINSPNDYVALQEDIDKVGSWSCTNFLTLNRAKCKYMIVSRRRTTSTPSSPLLLEGHPLDQVKMFKYLGVLLSHDLSWGKHVHSVCIVRLERSLAYSTDDFITMHQVILLSNSIFLWLDPILTMHQPFGPLM